MPMVYSLVYLTFTGIYYGAHGTDKDGNRYIYSSLDWSDPGGTGRLSAIIVIIVLPFFWLLMYCLYLLRRCQRILSTGEPKTVPVPPSADSASA